MPHLERLVPANERPDLEDLEGSSSDHEMVELKEEGEQEENQVAGLAKPPPSGAINRPRKRDRPRKRSPQKNECPRAAAAATAPPVEAGNEVFPHMDFEDGSGTETEHGEGKPPAISTGAATATRGGRTRQTGLAKCPAAVLTIDGCPPPAGGEVPLGGTAATAQGGTTATIQGGTTATPSAAATSTALGGTRATPTATASAGASAAQGGGPNKQGAPQSKL